MNSLLFIINNPAAADKANMISFMILLQTFLSLSLASKLFFSLLALVASVLVEKKSSNNKELMISIFTKLFLHEYDS